MIWISLEQWAQCQWTRGMASLCFKIIHFLDIFSFAMTLIKKCQTPRMSGFFFTPYFSEIWPHNQTILLLYSNFFNCSVSISRNHVFFRNIPNMEIPGNLSPLSLLDLHAVPTMALSSLLPLPDLPATSDLSAFPTMRAPVCSLTFPL